MDVNGVPLFAIGALDPDYSPDDRLEAQEASATHAVHFLCLAHLVGSYVLWDDTGSVSHYFSFFPVE